MKQLIIAIANFPLPFWRKFIPSLPDEIKSFNTVQRLWLVVSVPSFYSSIFATLLFFVLFIIILSGGGGIEMEEALGIIISIPLTFFLPIVFYHAVSIILQILSALFGFIFEKNLGTIKESTSNVVKELDSQTVLRYLLILLLIVVISALLIGMLSRL